MSGLEAKIAATVKEYTEAKRERDTLLEKLLTVNGGHPDYPQVWKDYLNVTIKRNACLETLELLAEQKEEVQP